MSIDLDRVRDAQRLLARYLPVVRLVPAASLSAGPRNVHLKLETELPTGSFKVRGAIFALSVNVAAKGGLSEVVAASTGNHGAAVAFAGRLLGVRATIFLPKKSNVVKVERIRESGAHIIEAGVDLSAAIDAAHEYATRQNAFFLHDATDPHIPVGTGTIAAEIVEQLPSVDALYVPMGDTALIRGVASAARQLKPDVQIIGVVAERAPAYYLSWKFRAPVPTETADTIADGLAVTRPLASNVASICELVDRVVTVSEKEMLAAINWLMTREHVIAEPAGAAATAGLLQESPPRGTIAVLVSGANIAPDVLGRVENA